MSKRSCALDGSRSVIGLGDDISKRTYHVLFRRDFVLVEVELDMSTDRRLIGLISGKPGYVPRTLLGRASMEQRHVWA